VYRKHLSIRPFCEKLNSWSSKVLCGISGLQRLEEVHCGLLGYNILEDGGRNVTRNVGKQEIARYHNLADCTLTLHAITSELYNTVPRSPYNTYLAISRKCITPSSL
jgi:hypothetical protein